MLKRSSRPSDGFSLPVQTLSEHRNLLVNPGCLTVTFSLRPKTAVFGPWVTYLQLFRGLLFNNKQ